MQLALISRKVERFPEKNYALSAKISDDLLFSHRLRFSHFPSIFAENLNIPLFSLKMRHEYTKLVTNSLHFVENQKI